MICYDFGRLIIKYGSHLRVKRPEVKNKTYICRYIQLCDFVSLDYNHLLQARALILGEGGISGKRVDGW